MLGEAKRDRRAERHEATRAEILEAAWELCRTEGLAGLSLRDLARRVGMQAPSLYSYFGSKHAIYDAMFAQGMNEFVEAQNGLQGTGDPLGDLKLMLRTFIEFCTDNSVRYQLLFQRTIPGFEPSPESFAPSVHVLNELARWLEGIGFGGQDTLDLFTAIGTGMTDQQISNDPGGDRWLRLVDDAAEMFFNHAKGKATTAKTAARAKANGRKARKGQR